MLELPDQLYLCLGHSRWQNHSQTLRTCPSHTTATETCNIVLTQKVMSLWSLGENEPEKTGNSEEKW